MKAPRATEAECTTAIIAGAIVAGWRVHHSRPAQMQSGRWATALQGHPGLPDLLLCRPPRVMFVELKRKPNKVEPEQVEWLDRLAACGVETRVIWVPEQQDEFLRELAKR